MPQGNGVVHGCMLVNIVYNQVHLVRTKGPAVYPSMYTVGTVRSVYSAVFGFVQHESTIPSVLFHDDGVWILCVGNCNTKLSNGTQETDSDRS